MPLQATPMTWRWWRLTRSGQRCTNGCEFFGAHCFACNVKKTKLLCSGVSAAPRLYSVDGSQRVMPLPAETDVRYLGVDINLRLDWRKTLVSMGRSVFMVAERIRRHAMDTPMTSKRTVTIQQVLLPRLRPGLLTFGDVPNHKLVKWDCNLRDAIYEGAGIRTSAGLTTEALYRVAGLPTR